MQWPKSVAINSREIDQEGKKKKAFQDSLAFCVMSHITYMYIYLYIINSIQHHVRVLCTRLQIINEII